MGYLTTFDDWIFTMYLGAAICVALHQTVVRFESKVESEPLRAVIIRLVEFFGRVLLGPLTLLYYIYTFLDPTLKLMVAFGVLVMSFFFFIGLRELGGIKKND